MSLIASLTNPTLQHLAARTKNQQGVVAFPESQDERVLTAAHWLLQDQLVQRVVLWGERAALQSKWEAVCRSKLPAQVVTANELMPHIAKVTAELVASRQQQKKRELAADELAQLSNNPLFQAGALLHQRKVLAAVAGSVATTGDVIRAALGTVGLAEGIRTVSGSFLMSRVDAHGVATNYIFADCGVVIEPTVEQLVDIAASSVKTFQALVPKQEPVVAFLSFSTKGSAQHPSVDKMRAAASLFQSRYPQRLSDGEMQFDAAFDAAIGQRKAPGSPIPGKANIFIFPDLNAGNIAYKITQRLAHFDAFGPLLQGTLLPYSDLSRGASVSDIALAACINIMLGTANAKNPA